MGDASVWEQAGSSVEAGAARARSSRSVWTSRRSERYGGLHANEV